MGILPQREPCPRRLLLKRSQLWSSLCPPLVLFLPPGRIDHISTGSLLKLGGRLCSTKPDSVPKISQNRWASNENTYVGFAWIHSPIGLVSAKWTALYPR